MNNLKIFSQILFVGLLFCANCELTPVDLCRNGIHDKTNGETGIDCGGVCASCRTADISKELMITDIGVVNHPEASNGKLSFGHLMENMSTSTITRKNLVMSFLKSWEKKQFINSFPVQPRQSIRSRVIEPWKVADGQAGVSDEDWVINFGNAPFRLLGIFNRMDLQRLNEDKSVKDAGEGRFVYGVLDKNGNPLQFTIIFEYELPIKDSTDVFKWASKWHELGEHASFDSSFVSELIEVTEKFVVQDTSLDKSNHNAINQIRTNEIAIGNPWELREFNLDEETGLLKEVTRKMTPDFSLNNTARLARFVKAHEEVVRDETFKIDSLFEGEPFLGGDCPTPFSFKWQIPNVDEQLRRNLSIQTCNGCHSGETNTFFTHIKPRSLSEEARISDFLSGELVERKIIFEEEFLGIKNQSISFDSSKVASLPSQLRVTGKDLLRKRRNSVH